MNATIISAVVRHLLTAVGGGLAVKWGIDGGTWEAIIGGASAAAGLVWSIAEKRKRAE
jgi:hypothetical protein